MGWRGNRKASVWTTSRSDVSSGMIKIPSLLLVSLVAVATLCAQSEPQKSPAGVKSAPPTVKEPGKAPAETSPPPIESPAAPKTTTDAKPKIDKNPPAFDVKNMDTSVKPSDDFFTYANGTWLKNTPIPPEESRWGSFNELIEKNNDALHEVAEKAAKAKPRSETCARSPKGRRLLLERDG